MKPSAIGVVTPKKLSTPLQIVYTNNTDEVKKVCAFEIFNKNPEGITAESAFTGGTSMEYMKKYFYENPHLSGMIRLQCTGLNGIQAEQVINKISKTPFGHMVQVPAIVPIEEFSKHQFQSGILDVQYKFLMDSMDCDLEFNLLPKTTLVMTIYFEEKMKGRNIEKLDALRSKCKNRNHNIIGSIVIDNSSDKPKELILFDIEKYKEYEKDNSLKIYSLFDVRHEDVLQQITYQNTYFNSIRTFVSRGSSENQKKQAIAPFEFNSGNKYHPLVELDGNEFQYGIADTHIVGEQLSSDNPIKVTVMPNTRVVYTFKHEEKINASSVIPSFISVDIENTTDKDSFFDILHYNEHNIPHEISCNKLKFNKTEFKANFMRIFFYNESQLHNPFKVIGELEEGKTIEKEIYPINHINEMKFNTNLIEIDFNFFELPIHKCHLLFDLKKGDGVSLIIANKNKTKSVPDNTPMFTKSDFEKSAKGGVEVSLLEKAFLSSRNNDNINWTPIRFENTTDEEKEIIIHNNNEEKFVIPKGVKCSIGGFDSGYSQLLDYLYSRTFDTLNMQRILSGNPAQITQVLIVTDYTDSKNQINNVIATQSYFSAMQFHSGVLNTAGFKLFDLEKVKDGVETKKDGNGKEYVNPIMKVVRKQKLTFKILPKSIVTFCISLERAGYADIVPNEPKQPIEIK